MYTPLVASGVQYGPSESGRNSGTELSEVSPLYLSGTYFSIYLCIKIVTMVGPPGHIQAPIYFKATWHVYSIGHIWARKETSHSIAGKVRAMWILIPISGWRNIRPPCLTCEKWDEIPGLSKPNSISIEIHVLN